MLKHIATNYEAAKPVQPPSGGCVLKLLLHVDGDFTNNPAAFRRLCVETTPNAGGMCGCRPSRLQAAVC